MNYSPHAPGQRVGSDGKGTADLIFDSPRIRLLRPTGTPEVVHELNDPSVERVCEIVAECVEMEQRLSALYGLRMKVIGHADSGPAGRHVVADYASVGA